MAHISDRSMDARTVSHRSAIAGDRYAFAALGLTLLSSIAISTFLVPALMLAIAGGLMLAAGLCLAGLLHWRGIRGDGAAVSGKDYAALLVLLGFAAAIMSGPTSLLL